MRAPPGADRDLPGGDGFREDARPARLQEPMPASTNTQLGVHYLAFAVVKFAGYSAYGGWLARRYRSQQPAWRVGLVRTALGMGFGALYALLVTRAPYGLLDAPDLAAYLGLLPVRVVEWSLLVALFFDRRLEQRMLLLEALLAGLLVSCALDLPAMLGFLLTGGMSIC